MIARHNFVCMDFETGGFDSSKNPITQVALIVTDFNLEETFRYESYVQNELNLEITEGATKVTGITASDARLLNGITIEALYKKLVEIFSKLKVDKYQKPIIIGHNVANFDILEFAQKYLFNRYKDSIFNYVEGYIFDTQYISRIKYLGKDIEGDFTLRGCCEREGVEITDAHNAINDVEANLKLAKILIKEQQLGNSNELKSEEGNGCRGEFYI